MSESEEHSIKTIREIAALADFRNAEPELSIKGLARLEKQFRETEKSARNGRARSSTPPKITRAGSEPR